MIRGSLVVRPFSEGRDEEAWISIVNEYSGHFLGPDFIPKGLEDLGWLKNSPWYDPSGMFLAELGGEPVGAIMIEVDERAGRRGMMSVWLRLSYVGTELERRMILFCLDILRSRGVGRVRTWVRDNMTDRIRLLEAEGFRKIRSFSVMKLDLCDLRTDIKGCGCVRLRPIELARPGDIGLLTFLLNEAFKGQFGFRPTTEEENKAWLSEPGKEFYGLFAYWGRTPVGYVVLEVSEELRRTGRKVGEVSTIGVLRPYRRLGIGTALLLEGLKWLRERGVEEAVLKVDDDNPTGAVRLYEKLGFRVACKEFVYERPVCARQCQT